jgi:hypothetical protein
MAGSLWAVLHGGYPWCTRTTAFIAQAVVDGSAAGLSRWRAEWSTKTTRAWLLLWATAADKGERRAEWVARGGDSLRNGAAWSESAGT